MFTRNGDTDPAAAFTTISVCSCSTSLLNSTNRRTYQIAGFSQNRKGRVLPSDGLTSEDYHFVGDVQTVQAPGTSVSAMS